MQIGELAKRGGVSVQTVRFYERKGLLPEPPRRESGYRNYSEEDLERVRFILQAKSLGFSLEEIRDILRMRERGKCPCVDVIAMAECHLREIEDRLDHLARFRNELERALRMWKRSQGQQLASDSFCILIERTMIESAGDHRVAFKPKASLKSRG